MAGWVARHNDDHPKLREELDSWNKEVKAKRFHATEWKKTDTGRARLSTLPDLITKQKPFGIFAIENRAKVLSQDDRSTYVDMIVDLIANVLFRLRKDGQAKQAFPLHVYMAERKGEWLKRIQFVLEYRLRVLLAGDHDKGLLNSYVLHVRDLNIDSVLLSDPSSFLRERQSLMPEMILADFICNALYRQTGNLTETPQCAVKVPFESWIFEGDPFWRDLRFQERQSLWAPLVLEITSARGRTWSRSHPEMAKNYDELFTKGIRSELGNGGEILLKSLQDQVLPARDWEQARIILDAMEKELYLAPLHKHPGITWDICRFRISIANHQGSVEEASRAYSQFLSLLDNEKFQRVEFIEHVTEYVNRRAVTLMDRYDFDDALKILQEALGEEERRMKEGIRVRGKYVPARFSDRRGKIASTMGQIYTKMAVRRSNLTEMALKMFDEAERNLMGSYDPAKLRNYRIEALLSMKEPPAEKIYALLTSGDSLFSAKNLFNKIGVNTYDMIYWLSWMAESRDKEYTAAVLGEEQAFLSLDPRSYPGMSLQYHFGRIALSASRESTARRFFLLPIEQPGTGKGYGVLDTLRLRSLCALALNFPGDAPQAMKMIGEILEGIKRGDLVIPAYFAEYADAAERGALSPKLLSRLEKDIPFR